MSASAQTSQPADPWVRLDWQRQDRHPLITVTALIGMAMALFGLPPIDPDGPFHRFGIMDPLRGGTRAARFTAHGE